MIHGEDKEIRLHRRFITSYKKNTLAVFFSFSLTFMLLTAMLVLLHTNHRIANIQAKTEFTPSDCYIKDVNKEQLETLKKDETITHLAVEAQEYGSYQRNNQNVFLSKCDTSMMTMTAKVTEGTAPDKEGEVAAEKWALLNLGIEPVINKEFVIQDPDTEEQKTWKLTGILSDMYRNKKYGVLYLYTPLSEQTDGSYVVYLRLKDGVHYDKKMKSLQSELGIRKKQIKECPAREDFTGLYQNDVKVISVILLICMVVFYGVYRIASITRRKQYGILRALGMKRGQLQKMILLELFQIYCFSVPVGIIMGLLSAYFIVGISGDRDKVVYLYGQKTEFVPVFPVWQILICVVVTALLVGLAGYFVGRKAASTPVMEMISDIQPDQASKKSILGIERSNSKSGTLFFMGCKYIFKDVKTSIFVILTICLGVTLFTGLAYRAQLLKVYREDTKEMYYLNGQYAMTMQYFNRADQGISRESKELVRNNESVASILTASGMPVRVLDEENTVRNDSYYNDHNKRIKEYYGYENAGYDGTNQVYKSILYGYNEDALEAMRKYVIDGDYDPKNMKDDEIIMQVLRMDDTGENDLPGFYREGTPLMQYKAGDEIQIKYPSNLDTNTRVYEEFADRDTAYTYKIYKIKAIVSFPYMYDCRRIVYPLLIIGDDQIQNMVPESAFQCMYVNGKSDMSPSQQNELERQLIRICNQNNNVSTRSLISEIEQNEIFYHKQMVYIYGIALVAFVLVMINMINNLRYRMQTRTREICMLRAVGMSVVMTRRMLLFENTTLGIAAVAAAFGISHLVLMYLYSISYMKAFGHTFQYDYTAFAIVSAAALLICMLLSFGILKAWKTKRIVEGIGNIE